MVMDKTVNEKIVNIRWRALLCYRALNHDMSVKWICFMWSNGNNNDLFCCLRMYTATMFLFNK